MSNDASSLAAISAAILSYNSDDATNSPLQTIKDESGVGKPLPTARLVTAMRMRRHEDRFQPGRWLIR
jgi:hypothetical protein